MYNFKPVVLVIRDGWGENHNTKEDNYNAVKLANTPISDDLSKNYPRTEILASGLSVGLPDGIMGNSEVGHQNIGAGRIVDQEIVRINKKISSGEINDNAVLKNAFDNVLINNSNLHLMGLLSDAGVHSMIDHLFALILSAKSFGIKKIFIHAFTDGRDSGPFTGISYIKKLESFLNENSIGSIATILGRYWAMDRDNRWDRVERAFNSLTNVSTANHFKGALEALDFHYKNPEHNDTLGDEFCPPSIILDKEGFPLPRVSTNDSVVFFNYRGDRPRELTKAFIEKDFSHFNRGSQLDIFYATMTEYQKGLCSNVIFPKPKKMKSILGEYVSNHKIPQYRCAETEKFPHVTFFFNDYREEPFPYEDRVLVPSPKDCATYDKRPEMSAYKIKEEAIKAIKSRKYGLIIINFANPDMVGHTGVLKSCIKACEVVDECLGEIIKAIDNVSGSLLVTADHGNSDKLWNEENESPHTAHTLNPVEVVLYGVEFKNKKLKKTGCLGDVAPTLLDMMGLNKPFEMSGDSLII